MNGNASGFHLHDILLLVGLEQRTGELIVESGNNIGTVLFHQGNILQAFSPYSRAIGDLLVEDNILSDAELLEALRLQKLSPHVPIGSLLMKTGKVSFEVVEMMVHEQIRRAIRDFAAWNPVDFSFVQKEIHPFDTIRLPVYEFVPSDFVKSAMVSLAGTAAAAGNATSPAAPASNITSAE
jgi:hypothetical protein